VFLVESGVPEPAPRPISGSHKREWCYLPEDGTNIQLKLPSIKEIIARKAEQKEKPSQKAASS